MKLLWHKEHIEVLDDSHRWVYKASEGLESHSFDEIEIVAAINALETPEWMMAEVKRLMSPNGIVKLHFILIEMKHTPFSDWHYRIRCKKAGVKFSLEEIERIIEQSGFMINKNSIETFEHQRRLDLELVDLQNEMLLRAANV